MTSLISDTGRALYGDRWQVEMARALGVNERTVRRWAAGDGDPRPGVFQDLHRLVSDRMSDLGTVEAQLRQTTRT